MIIDPRKAKIKWQCRRGMLELDLILTAFIDNGLNALTTNQLEQFERLLQMPDPILYQWLVGQDNQISKESQEIVKLIQRSHNSR